MVEVSVAVDTNPVLDDEPKVEDFDVATYVGPGLSSFGFGPHRIGAQLDAEQAMANNVQLGKEEANMHNADRVGVMRVRQSWDKDNYKWKETKATKPTKIKKKKIHKYVFKCAKRQGSDGLSTIVYIYGEHIRTLLKELTKDDNGPSFQESEELDSFDMKLLYHKRDDLKARLNEERAKSSTLTNHELVFEIQAALDVINEYFLDVDLELSELPKGEITYALLWTLFPPRSFITARDDLNQDMVCRVRSTTYRLSQTMEPMSLDIEADYIDYNGTEIGYVSTTTFSINYYRSARPILDLGHFPYQLKPDYVSDKITLLERAGKVLQLHGRHLQEYQGHAMLDTAVAYGKFNSHGRVMLDPATLESIKPNNRLVPYIKEPIIKEYLTEDQKLLVNPQLYGFSLGDKIWGSFAVSRLRDVEWNDDIIDALMIPEVQKEFVRDLVESHSESGFDDIVRDKGKGLVGLLSGPPGVGKTLTAEAVAEIARRPLYMITSGELGSKAESVQSGLDNLMELSEAWNAVVLLDEADVFLQERDNGNLARNAITSIFLRRLEYYQGILILATNRHTTFDPAFKSRIHFTIDYPDLDASSRKEIWTTFITRASASGKVETNITGDECDKLAELPLNGRQIKNIINISQTVAVRRKTPITYERIRVAMRFSGHSFDEHNDNSTHGS